MSSYIKTIIKTPLVQNRIEDNTKINKVILLISKHRFF